MNQNRGNVVLITGASSGIGKAIAVFLSAKGYKVYGTARNPDPDAPAGPVAMLRLDVRDEESVRSAVAAVLRNEGRIDVLINNAGFGLAGAIEDTSVQDARRQFDTNFFGVLSVCNEVLPSMRARKNGLIINVSSVAGMISIPFQSMYSASKYALEALSETLRVEVRPFGVRVSLIEPGDTKTGFTGSRKFASKAKSADSAYAERFGKSIKVMEHDEMNGPEPDKVVRGVYSLIRRRNPPIRKVIGMKYKLILFLKRILPSRAIEKIIALIYG